MSDDNIPVKPSTDPTAKKVDNEKVGSGSAAVYRQRIEIAGLALLEIARVLNAAPGGSEYALVTRNIPSGVQGASLAANDPGVLAIIAQLAAMQAAETVDVTDRVARILGHVAVDSLPALPAGANVIGHVIADAGSTTAVTALPAIPTGANTIGAVTAPGAAALALDSTVAKDATLQARLPAALTGGGGVKVGVVDALPAGTNTIGAVTGPAAAALALDATALAMSAKLPATLGSKADAASLAVTQSTEDKAVLAALSAKLPASLGTKTAATSLSVGLSSDDAAKVPSKGSATMAGSTPVTIATDDTVLTGMSGKLPASLGTKSAGTSLSVALSTEDAAKVPSKGTAIMTGSTPVTIATDDTLMSAIKLDVDKIPSKGTAAMAGSTPVTLATDDGARTDLDALAASAVAADGVLGTKSLLVAGVGQDTAPAQGTIGRQRTPWFSRVGATFAALTDAAGAAIVAIKAASTKAAFTDAALVVDVRPGGVFPADAAPADAAALGSMSKIWSALAGYNGASLDLIRSGNVTIDSIFTGILNTLPQSVFHTTPTTRANGQRGMLEADSAGNMRTGDMFMPAAEDNPNAVIAQAFKYLANGAYSPTSTKNLGSSTGANIKATATVLLGFFAHNLNGANRYVHFFNKATPGVNGDIPELSFKLDGNDIATEANRLALGPELFGPNGKAFATGISYAISTTETTLTLAAASDWVIFISTGP